MIEFTLYSRSYCHLCDDMLHALEALKQDFSFTIKVEDVDANPVLVEQYDELVPVLVGKNGERNLRLCHYFFDETKVRSFLQGDFIEEDR